MRRLLLDTQVFIWLINNDERLSRTSKAIISNRANEVNLSFFSLYEIQIKSSIGKLDFEESMIEKLNDVGINLLMPDINDLRLYTVHDSKNRDPFDNALITVSINNGLEFITADKSILNIRNNKFSRINARK